MPIQRLSLFGALPARHLEAFVRAIQSLSADALEQFKTLTRVFRDDSLPQGRRPSDFLRIRQPVQDAITPATSVIEVMDGPEINKKPVTSRIVHVVSCTSGSAVELARSMGYTEFYAYFEQGYALLIGSVQMRIYQIFRAQPKSSQEMDTQGNKDTAQEANLEGLAIGDGTTWIVQAELEAKTGSPEDLRKGTEELLRLKKEVMGFVDLIPLIDELR